jgi:hypothetical protein
MIFSSAEYHLPQMILSIRQNHQLAALVISFLCLFLPRSS